MNKIATSAMADCIMDATGLKRALVRLSHEIVERHPQPQDIVLAGVRSRGVPLAQRIADNIAATGHATPQLAALDLRAYRDDCPRPHAHKKSALASVNTSSPVPDVDGAVVIVVDDVFYTGRTLRAALDALADMGRPAVVELAVIIDRGHRELPLRATYVGKNIPTAPDQHVAVRLTEIDGADGVWLT